MREIVVGTRKSKLAVMQTNLVIEQLAKKTDKYRFRVQEIDTYGDQNLQVPLAKLAGGVFLTELEDQLLSGDIDFAVHSLKDIPLVIPQGLVIAAIPEREDHRDAYIARDNIAFADLPAGGIIGTSSLRRGAQVLAMRDDLQTKMIRGPVDKRMEQLESGDYDAIILAVAGLKRLGIDEQVITEYLPDRTFLPAMGQGALAIECRSADAEIRELVHLIHHEASALATETERLFLSAFNEGEQAPIAGYAKVTDGEIHLQGMVISLDGKQVLRYEATGENPALLAKVVADGLIGQGANEIIRRAKGKE